MLFLHVPSSLSKICATHGLEWNACFVIAAMNQRPATQISIPFLQVRILHQSISFFAGSLEDR